MKIDYKSMEELAEEGMSYGKIADILDVDLRTVVEYLEGLKSQAGKRENEAIQYGASRREQIAQLRLEQKMSVADIAKKMEISESFVKEDLMAMGIDAFSLEPTAKPKKNTNKERMNSKPDIPSTQTESPEAEAERRRQIVRLMYEKDKKPEEIYSMFSDIPRSVISKDIRYMLRNKIYRARDVSVVVRPDTSIQSESSDERLKTKSKTTRASKTQRSERREKLLDLLRGKKMTQKQMAEALGVSQPTVSADIRYLIEAGIITKEDISAKGKKKEEEKPEGETQINERGKKETGRKSQIRERREKLLGLLRSNNNMMTQGQMAKILDVSQATICNDIKYLIREGMITREEINKGETQETVRITTETPTEQTSEPKLEPKSELSLEPVVSQKSDEEVSPKQEAEQAQHIETEVESELIKKEESDEKIETETTNPEIEVPNQVQQKPEEKTSKGIKRNSAERKYILMMIGKIKSLSVQGKTELAIQYLETLLKEMSFTEAEKKQFFGIMKTLQGERVKKIKQRYFSADNSDIGANER